MPRGSFLSVFTFSLSLLGNCLPRLNGSSLSFLLRVGLIHFASTLAVSESPPASVLPWYRRLRIASALSLWPLQCYAIETGNGTGELRNSPVR